ncbi:MAG: hypothetical protein FJY77_04695 [Candidatus Altiarchaeales archaeon]|nr:hypothetical protein [Candidatus Altiarchaeales archaeon]
MKLVKHVLLLFLAFLLAQNVSAWGNRTYMYACDEVVKYVWGSEVLESCIYKQTLDFQKNFCDTVLYANNEAYKACINLEGIMHPALMPSLLFNDQEKHRDYSSCPINNPMDSRYLCSNARENPALDNALMWFETAGKAQDVCTRIYEFCIGSNYLADSYNPLNHIVYGIDKGTCPEVLSEKVENRIIENSPAGWGINQVCVFKYTREMSGQGGGSRYSQPFSVSNKTFALLVENLAVYASNLSQMPYASSTTTTEITTTTEETTIPTTLPPTTVPPTTRTTSTTMPKESGGVGFGAILVLVLILVAVGYFALKQSGIAKEGPKLGRAGFRGGVKPLERQTLRSLQSEESIEGIMPEDRTRSRLGSVGARKEGEEQ